MTTTEHHAKTPSATTGLFATLAGLLRAKGGSAPALRLAALIALSIAAFLAATTAAPASAAIVYTKIGEIPGAGSGPFGSLRSESVAVNDKNSHIYVADSAVHRVYDFTSAADTSPTEWDGSSTPAGEFEGSLAVAVDNSSGDVYVADSAHKVIDKFDQDGNLIASFGDSENEITHTPEPNGQLAGLKTPAGSFKPATAGSFGIAVDQATGKLYVLDAEHQVIDVFGPAGAYLEEQFTETPGELFGNGGSFTDGIAINDKTGQLLVASSWDLKTYRFDLSTRAFIEPAIDGHETPATNFGAGYTSVAADNASGRIYINDTTHHVVDAYNPDATYSGSQITGTPSGEGGGLAVDQASGEVYVADKAAGAVEIFEPATVPDLTVEAPSSLTTTSATLRGQVNPASVEVEECAFEYVTQAHFDAEGFQGAKTATCATEGGAPIGSGTEAVAVHAEVSELNPGTRYHLRLFATNANGANHSPEITFTTGAAIDSASVIDVTATSATLQAEINPLGDATAYRFEYLTEAAYLHNEEEGKPPFTGATRTPVPDAPLGAGTADVSVSQHLQGLSPRTSYRYRVLATNDLGTTTIPFHTFTTQTSVAATALPDGRSWEQVSPPDKHGATLAHIGELKLIQAAADGDAISYVASAPIESQPPGYSQSAARVLSARGPGGWSSRDISLPHTTSPGETGPANESYHFFSPDLSRAIIQPNGAFEPSLSPEASEQTAFLRTDFPAGSPTSFCTEACYRPLVTGAPGFANVPEGTIFAPCPEGNGSCAPWFRGATTDLSHVVLSSNVALTSTPLPANTPGLYEWSADAPPTQALHLISVLPGGGPAPDPHLGSTAVAELARGAISADGSRVVWSEGLTVEQHHLYLRYNATEPQSFVNGSGECTEPAKACTIQLDQVQGGSGSGGVGPLFHAASSDGSRVFFTDTQQLTPNSGADGQHPDLYEYDLEKPPGERVTDLTPDSGGESAQVQGAVIGAAEDGSALYFVANGVLAPGGSPGNCGTSGAGKTCNLYLYERDAAHPAGQVVFIASLAGEDHADWQGGNMISRSARVSPNGRWLAFMSQRPLTGYDNRDAVSGKRDEEVYLYHAPASAGDVGTLICASCNPTGARPHGVEYAKVERGLVGEGNWEDASQWFAANIPGWTDFSLTQGLYQSRFLSNSGRLFFNAADALVPQDSNGTEDVYQYEPATVGGCSESRSTFSGSSGGCLDLISSGTSAEESAFLDASASGDDVFFLTSAQLTRSDADTSLDVYDARVGGGFPEAVSAVECAGDACQQPAVPPNHPTPGTVTLNGPGNLHQTRKHHRKKHRHKRHHRKSHRRANSNRGGAR